MKLELLVACVFAVAPCALAAHPCDVLNKHNAEELLGSAARDTQPGNGQSLPDSHVRGCLYFTVARNPPLRANVSLMMSEFRSKRAAASEFVKRQNPATTGLLGVQIQRDLGDAAVLVKTEESIGLSVLQGSVIFDVNLNRLGWSQDVSIQTRLMRVGKEAVRVLGSK